MLKHKLALFLALLSLLALTGCQPFSSSEEETEEEETMVFEEVPSQSECEALLIGTWQDDESQNEYLINEDRTYMEIEGDTLYSGTWSFENEDDIPVLILKSGDEEENILTYRYQISEDQNTIDCYDPETSIFRTTWTRVTSDEVTEEITEEDQ